MRCVSRCGVETRIRYRSVLVAFVRFTSRADNNVSLTLSLVVCLVLFRVWCYCRRLSASQDTWLSDITILLCLTWLKQKRKNGCLMSGRMSYWKLFTKLRCQAWVEWAPGNFVDLRIFVFSKWLMHAYDDTSWRISCYCFSRNIFQSL